MSDNDSLRGALESLRHRRERKLDELKGLEQAIRHVEQELGGEGETQTVPVDFSGVELPDAPSTSATRGTSTEVRDDEFFGLSHGEAAKRFLKKVGHAVTLEGILQALEKGGCRVGGANPKKTFYISLVRNPRDFVLVKPNVIGLREFYPGLKRGIEMAKPKKRQVGKKRRAKRRRAAAKKEPGDSALSNP